MVMPENSLNLEDPFQTLNDWINQAAAAGVQDPNAMVLSTLSIDGSMPSSRVVLFKGVESEGLAFYTNYESRKGQELAAHPVASAVFFWHALAKQVRVEGKIIKLSREQSQAYFATRPRESQIGAWASNQSREIASREMLEANLKAFTEKFEGRTVPCPPHWGGFALIPERFEFWIGNPARLHDRHLLVRQKDGTWKKTRLSP